jgi:hypothetical protein
MLEAMHMGTPCADTKNIAPILHGQAMEQPLNTGESRYLAAQMQSRNTSAANSYCENTPIPCSETP